MLTMALVVLLVMAAAGVRSIAGSRVALWVALAAALVWPFVNRPIEGPVLLVIGRGHGVTVSDLLTPVVVLLSVMALSGRFRRSAPGSDAG